MNKSTKLFFDLDGTLIDSRCRLYTLFQNLVPNSDLSFNDYWRLKRNGISNEQILIDQFKYDQKQIFNFNNLWMQLIEKDNYLKLDIPLLGVDNYLNVLKKRKCSLNLVTARQSVQGVKKQLTKFGWNSYFDDTFVTQKVTSKSNLIRPYLSHKNINFIIGDTRDDILTGQELKINTVAVLTGFLSREKLEEYNPNLIVDSVINFNPF